MITKREYDNAPVLILDGKDEYRVIGYRLGQSVTLNQHRGTIIGLRIENETWLVEMEVSSPLRYCIATEFYLQESAKKDTPNG